MDRQSDTKKLIFVYDYLDSLGGAEYVVDRLQMSGNFKTMVGYKNQFLKSYYDSFDLIDSISKLKPNIINRFILLPIKFCTYFKKYFNDEKIIFSGQFSIFGALFRNKKLNYLYSHSLPKFCFYNDIYRKKNLSLVLLIFIYRLCYKKIYTFILFNKIEKNFVNSKYTANEFRTKLKYNSNTVREPIFSEKVNVKFPDIPKSNYFICSDRYHYSKNIDYLIEEFKKNRLPVVFTNLISTKIKQNLKNYKNFSFYDNLDLPDLLCLILRSQALISLAENEDYGLNVQYALNLNKPVIVLNSGYMKYLNNKLINYVNFKNFRKRINKITFPNQKHKIFSIVNQGLPTLEQSLLNIN